MTLQEKIQKKSEGFGKLAPVFLEGAKFALDNQWINVDEDLPCNHQELTHSNYTDRVLVLSRNGYSEVAFMCIIEDVWEWNTLMKVSYWMPIPKLPNNRKQNYERRYKRILQ